MWITLASLLQVQCIGTTPTQVDLRCIQFQLQTHHSHSCSLQLYLSQGYAEEAAIHCRPSVNCSLTALLCSLSFLLTMKW